MQISNPGGTSGGSLAADDTAFIAARERVWGAGVNYDIGAATTVGIVYSHTDLSNATNSVYVGNFANTASSLKFDNVDANVKYQSTPSVFAGAMYTYTLGHFNSNAGNSEPKWHQLGLMADYRLSPRTDVFAQGLYQHLASGAPNAAPLDTAYITGADAPSTSPNQFLGRVAIRQTF